jgi:hypothetical protein
LKSNSHFKDNGNGNRNRNAESDFSRFCRVQYPKGIAPWSQTGIALSAYFLD